MSYRISCECGKDLSVEEGMAGVDVTCVCGRVVKVPPLRELRSGRFHADLAPNKASGAVRPNVIAIGVLLAIGIVVAASVFLRLSGPTAFGLLLVIVGRIWMLAVGISVNPNLGCLLVLIPEIMMILFAANNPKLALPPLCCVIAGIILVISGLAV
jgi:hypothetical protein